MFYKNNMEKSTVNIQRAENSSQLWLQDAFLHLACMEFQRVQRLDLSLVSIYSIKAHQLQGEKKLVAEHLPSRKTTTLWRTDAGESFMLAFAGLAVYLLL